MDIEFSTNNADLAKQIRTGAAEGIRATQKPIRMGFKDCVEPDAIATAINIDLQITIDVTKITAIVAATWLANKSKLFSGKHYIKINGDNIAIDNPESIKLIEKIIDTEKNDK